MTGRPGIEITIKVPADGGESPNAFDPNVTVHVRVHWPPLATDEQIAQALVEASAHAMNAVEERRSRTPRGHPTVEKVRTI